MSVTVVVARHLKDPDAVLDYPMDWSDWLASGATIAASTWEADTGITKVRDTKTADRTVVWLSGGEAGENYVVTNHVTDSDGREEERSLLIVVRER